MPEEKEKISIEELISGESTSEVKEDKLEKPKPAVEKESTVEEESTVEKIDDNEGEDLENNEGKEGEGEIGGIVKTGNAQQQKSKQLKEIEDIMSSDLKVAFLEMKGEKRVEFKRVGEETAVKINELLEKTKVKVKKIIRLLRKWLSIIPGANKYFLEQKAKIKADEIIALKNKE